MQHCLDRWVVLAVFGDEAPVLEGTFQLLFADRAAIVHVDVTEGGLQAGIDAAARGSRWRTSHPSIQPAGCGGGVLSQDLTQVEGRTQDFPTSDGQHTIAHAYGAQPTAFNGGARRGARRGALPVAHRSMANGEGTTKQAPGRARRLVMSLPRVWGRSGSTRTRVDTHSGERGDPVAQPGPPHLLLMGAELCKLYLGNVSELYHFGGARDPA
jgi:hypothetical protein